MAPRGWIGYTLDAVPQLQARNSDGEFITYYAYPKIMTIDEESPAERAGIQPGDTLVAYNGQDLIGRAFNITQLLVPDKRLAVTVRRDGTTKDYAVTVAKAPNRFFVRRMDFDGADEARVALEESRRRAMTAAGGMSRGGRPSGGGGKVETGVVTVGSGFGAAGASAGASPSRMFVVSPNGMFGASMSAVGPELAKALKLETGVLVNDVPEATPAYSSGLRPGDVIVSVGNQPVVTMSELRGLIVSQMASRSVQLQVVRDKKTRNLTVSW